MTQTYDPSQVDPAVLEAKPLAPPAAEPLSGEIMVRAKVEFANDERTIISGTWESDRGASRWEFLTRGEIIHLLSGAMTVHRDGEEPVDLVPGSVAYFPLGWTGVWTVTEPVRKFYVVYK